MSRILANNPSAARSSMLINKFKLVLETKGLPAPLAQHGHYKEYGCGVYGCVFGTSDPNVVFKVTNDVSEAGFAVISQNLLARGLMLQGLTRYHGIYVLPTSSDEIEPEFAIWREAAQDVGEVFFKKRYVNERTILGEMYDWDDHDAREAHTVSGEYLMMYKDWAESLYFEFKAQRKKRGREQAIAWAQEEMRRNDLYNEGSEIVPPVTQCIITAEAMRGVDYLRPIARTYIELAKVGVFIGDVHMGNLGMAPDRVSEGPVITDPGHAAVLNPDFMDVKIPPL